jgi:S-adenosylmethionine:diacylglycerol 3-amino-3-carboxypropyl transferase
LAAVIASPDSLDPVLFRDVFPQAALVQLKIAAVRVLPVQSVRSFLGLGHFGRRVWFYHELRASLSEPVRGYWDAREREIRGGLLTQGRYEREIERFRVHVLPRVLPAGAVDTLVSLGTLAEQQAWVAENVQRRRWRLIGVLPVARRLNALLTTVHLPESPELQWRLMGRYLDLEQGPAYLSTPGHKLLRAGLDRVRVEVQP